MQVFSMLLEIIAMIIKLKSQTMVDHEECEDSLALLVSRQRGWRPERNYTQGVALVMPSLPMNGDPEERCE
jgi:hypothetical protein